MKITPMDQATGERVVVVGWIGLRDTAKDVCREASIWVWQFVSGAGNTCVMTELKLNIYPMNILPSIAPVLAI
jgi:hypothetical protein